MNGKIKVDDPFGAAADAALPSVALALDPEVVGPQFKRGLPRLSENGTVVLKSIRVLRHKPGKRCVIEYDVRVEHPGHERTKSILIGKIRARRFGNEGYRRQEAFWQAGFQSTSPDKICVPEPIGVVPGLRMWLQRKVKGEVSMKPLAAPAGVALAGRIAEAIHKVHRARVPTERTHTMQDELQILGAHLPQVGQERPELAKRITRLLANCVRLGTQVRDTPSCGIHRDFYPAQVIVKGRRLFLLDFDLYCRGDPALDVGNFIGHVTEESLRTLGEARALEDREAALAERFIELSGEDLRGRVRVYTLLTLARHVYLSTQFPDRRAFTEPLLELAERGIAEALKH